MSISFDNPEYPATPSPLPTDTLVDSVLILLTLSVVQRLVGFVRAVLFCRWLDAEQLGVWDMTFNFLLLAAPLGVLAIPGTFGRYLEYYRQRGQLRAFLQRTFLTCGGLALAASAGVLWARQWFSALIFGEADKSNMIVLAATCLTVVIAFSVLVELFIALRCIRLASIMQLINGLSFAVLGVTLLLSWECSAKSVLLAYGGSCLIAAVWAGCRLPRVWRASSPAEAVSPHVSVWAKVAPFAACVLLANVLMNLFGVMDRYMIVHFSRLPAAEALDIVGNYHTSRVVPLLLVSIAAMLSTMITPHLSHDWEAGRRDLVTARLRLFLKLFGFALFAAADAVLLAAPLLFQVAFRGKFPGGEAMLSWTLIYCMWFSLLLVMQSYLLCAEKAWLSSVALGCGLMLNVALNMELLPRFGLPGAVLSTTAANALSLGLICLFTHRLGFHLDPGVRLALVLPALVCLGPWVATFALVVIAALAVCTPCLLTPDEKHQLAEGITQYMKRFGINRPIASHSR